MTTSKALQLSRSTICRLIPGMMAAPARARRPKPDSGPFRDAKNSTKGCTINLSYRCLLALGRNGAIYLAVMGFITG